MTPSEGETSKFGGRSEQETAFRKFVAGTEMSLPGQFRGRILKRKGDVVLLVKSKTHLGFTREFYEVCVLRRITKDHRFPSGSVVLAGRRKFREISESPSA